MELWNSNTAANERGRSRVLHCLSNRRPAARRFIQLTLIFLHLFRLPNQLPKEVDN